MNADSGSTEARVMNSSGLTNCLKASEAPAPSLSVAGHNFSERRDPCGSGLAREGGVSGNISVKFAAAPTGIGGVWMIGDE
ncbi:hypothetical protein ACYZT9_11205 [Pseudomonas sp. ZT5P21]